MTGLRLKLDVDFTDTTLPVFIEDPILAPGSLWLWDAQQSIADSAVPAHGASFRNLAWREAAAVLGSGTEQSLASVFEYAADPTVLLERSTKGGLHGIAKTTGLTATKGFIVNAPTAVRQHIINNPGHAFYYAQWHRITRTAAAPGGGAQHVAKISKRAGYGSAMLAVCYNGAAGQQIWFVATGNRTNIPQNRLNGTAAAGAAERISMGTLATTTAPFWGTNGAVAIVAPTDPSDFIAGASVGPIDPANAAAGSGSRVLYRTYLEDLTVSGRTYGQVDALSAAAFATATGTGGRYADDTYTSPASVLA